MKCQRQLHFVMQLFMILIMLPTITIMNEYDYEVTYNQKNSDIDVALNIIKRM